MHVLIPCKQCKEELSSVETPNREIASGHLIKEDDLDADFHLKLVCGHEQDYVVTLEEKDAILSNLGQSDATNS